MLNRPAQISDLERLMTIVSEAQRFLKDSGVDQWQNGYPTAEIIRQDILKRCCHVFLLDEEIAGFLSVFFETDKSYSYIEGKWSTNGDKYAVFHRAAVSADYRGKGIANEMLSLAENITKDNGFLSLRGDTHPDNKAMRGLLEKRGYNNCGIIFLDEEKTETNRRVAYEKLV